MSAKKRSDQRLGHASKASMEAVDKPPNSPGEILGPEAPDWLDGFAREWYDSLRVSGQAIYYTESDWTSAVVIAVGVMNFIRRPTATMLAAVLDGFHDMGATEASRRKMNIELGSAAGLIDPDEDAGATEADQWYKKMKLVPDSRAG